MVTVPAFPHLPSGMPHTGNPRQRQDIPGTRLQSQQIYIHYLFTVPSLPARRGVLGEGWGCMAHTALDQVTPGGRHQQRTANPASCSWAGHLRAQPVSKLSPCPAKQAGGLACCDIRMPGFYSSLGRGMGFRGCSGNGARRDWQPGHLGSIPPL